MIKMAGKKGMGGKSWKQEAKYWERRYNEAVTNNTQNPQSKIEEKTQNEGQVSEVKRPSQKAPVNTHKDKLGALSPSEHEQKSSQDESSVFPSLDKNEPLSKHKSPSNIEQEEAKDLDEEIPKNATREDYKFECVNASCGAWFDNPTQNDCCPSCKTGDYRNI